ncbi:cytochrome P450 [Suillus subaureus]|uniref:Cytochrome P450 n=1 Tax=Suillus subaureus TaxID=48587 RepID=A0A9P7EK62_9AGAM|nr:cytochrome P450 [Suillus subaureus]KAG1823417.1 cytochrome P450 [Suillus subaureus]
MSSSLLNAIKYLVPLQLEDLNYLSALLLIPVPILLAYVIPYLRDPYNQRSIPGPFLARFSDIWLGWVASQGHRSDVVHQLHNKYGTFVRLAPNHISIADPDALQIVYAHGSGSLKSNFYDAFVSIHRGLFNTRDRADHSRKRKIVAHVFSQKNVLEFEPSVRLYVGQFMNQWDRLSDEALKNQSGTEGEGGWFGKGGRLWLDCLPWYNYLAFDIIGDLAFGSPFGMVLNAKDSAPVAISQKDAMNSYGSQNECAYVDIPAVQILNDRGEFSASMGVLPPAWRRWVLLLPWYRKGGIAVKNLAGLAVAAVAKRFTTPTDRVDLLSKLQEGRDDEGNLMGKEELTAEALTQLIAGSDTTSNSSCAITYYLAANLIEDEYVSTYEQVKHLPYLEAVINEALRIHSTSSLGLPRVVPEGGLTIQGIHFPQGAVLSVPSYTIHRNTRVWGEDADVFRPERWFERDHATLQKTFNPFSYGPRACVGRNLASMELLIIISSVLRRYEFVLADPDKVFDTREGFLRKPVECRVGIKRRQ